MFRKIFIVMVTLSRVIQWAIITHAFTSLRKDHMWCSDGQLSTYVWSGSVIVSNNFLRQTSRRQFSASLVLDHQIWRVMPRFETDPWWSELCFLLGVRLLPLTLLAVGNYLIFPRKSHGGADVLTWQCERWKGSSMKVSIIWWAIYLPLGCDIISV